MSIPFPNSRFLLALLALMMIGALALAITTPASPPPPRFVNPFDTAGKGCRLAVALEDFVFEPLYQGDKLISVTVTAKGVDPAKANAYFNLEPSYNELEGTGNFWHAMVTNAGTGVPGLGPKLVRAGDLWLTKQFGSPQPRQLFDTASKPDAWGDYLSCAEIVLRAVRGSNPLYSFVPVP